MAKDVFEVACPYCKAVAGQQCWNTITNRPLNRFTAHPARMRLAEK